MIPAIVVELPPGDAASPGVGGLLETCTLGALGRARCVSSGSAARDEASIAVAVVTWDGPDRLRARIEIGLRVDAVERWQSRDLSFSQADPEPERWRAVGFAVATVVGEALGPAQEGTNAPAAAAQPQPQPQPAPGNDVPPSAPARELAPSGWLDAALVATTGVGAASPAVGGALRVARTFDASRWFACGDARFTVKSASGATLSSSGASAGLGLVAIRVSDLRLALRLQPAVQLAAADARDARTGVSGQVFRWLAGLREGADASWTWSEHLGLVAGIEASEWSGSTEIRAHDGFVALIPAVDFSAVTGIQVSFR